MIKLYYLMLLFFLPFLLNACATFPLDLLNPRERISPQIPFLDLQIDMKSLGKAYSLESRILHEDSTGVANWNQKNQEFKFESSEPANNVNHVYLDKRVQDALTIFQREFERNICEPSNGGAKGFIVCRIRDCKKDTNSKWIIPAAVLFLVPLGFGYPAYSLTVDMDLEVLIYDQKKGLIKKYSALGADTEYSALYWGFILPDEDKFQFTIDTDSEISRTACAKALLAGIKDIKGQIQADAAFLSQRLMP